ncbi:MAG: VCBS repeat-containing protein, partial [Verrucomicrobiales bacterium]
KAFSLMEAMVSIALIGLVSAVALLMAGGTVDSAKLTKLESDVSTVNQAIKVYLANGGDFDAFSTSAISLEASVEIVERAESPVAQMMADFSSEEEAIASSPSIAATAILDKLKTRRSATDAAAYAGFSGSMLDKRLTARIQSSGDASNGEHRAVWNPAELKFEITSEGLPGIDYFHLDEALAAVDFGEESREGSSIDLNVDSGWIWAYVDAPGTPRAPGPTIIPVTGGGGGSIPSPPNLNADLISISEDTVASTAAGTAPNVLANDIDADGGGLTITGYTSPANGALVLSPDGTIVSYLGNPNYYGSDFFTYTVTDNSGDTATATVSITVNPENDLPNLADSANALNEAANGAGPGSVSGSLAGSVSDVDPSDSHTFVGSAAGSVGTLSVAADGSYTFALDDSNPTVDSLSFGDSLMEVFTVTVDDGNGGTDTASLSITITITINGVNDAPDLLGAFAAVTERSNDMTPSTVSGNLVGNDPELTPLLFATTAAASYGVFTVDSDGGYAYNLDNTLAAVNGLRLGGTLTELLSVEVSDSEGLTAFSNLVMTIHGVNDSPIFATPPVAPIAPNDGTTVFGSIAGDFQDPDIRDTHTFSFGSPAHGTLSMNAATGVWQFLANTSDPSVIALAIGETLADSVSVTVTDAGGLSATTNIALTVLGAVSPPPTPLDPPTIATSAAEFVPTLVESIDVILTDPNPSGGTDSKVQYRIDGVSWTDYSGMFAITLASYPAGATIEAKAVALTAAYTDSSIASESVGVAAAPVIALDLPVIAANSIAFVTAATETVAVTITNPNLPTVSEIEYRVNSGAWQPYSGIFSLLITDYFLNGATIEARAVATDPAYSDSTIASEGIGGPSLEFTTYNLDINVGDSVTILDNLIHGSLVLGTHFEFFYEDTETWHLAEFNANTTVTTVASDLSGGNSGAGQYRISVRFIGNTDKEDWMEIRIADSAPNVFADFCASGLGQYGVVVMDGGEFKLSHEDAAVLGDVGIAPGSSWTISNGAVTGAFNNHPGTSGSGGDTQPGPGGDPISPISSDLSALATEAVDISNDAASLSATQTFGDIKDSATISATASDGLNVITLNKVALTNSAHVLTLTGGASDYFVINIAASVKMTGGSTWAITGGLQPSNVIFNMLPGSSEFSGTGGSSVESGGIILAPHSGTSVTLTGASVIEGTVIVGDGGYTATGGSQVLGSACGGGGGSGGSTTALDPPEISIDAPEFVVGSVETINVLLTDHNANPGVDSAMQYRLDGGAWTTYAAPFPITIASFPTGVLIEAKAIPLTAGFTESTIANRQINVAAPASVTTVVDADFDTSIAGSVPNWSGDSVQLYCADSDPSQTLVYFNLTDDIAGPATVVSAVLYLTSTDPSGTNGDFPAHEILPGVNWTGGGFTWNLAGNGLQTDDNELTAGPEDTSTVTAVIPGVSGTSDRKMWDITALVQKWVDDADDNNGVAILPPAGERDIFSSMEHAGVSVRPKLVIEWTAP